MKVFTQCIKKPWGRENVKIGTYPKANKTIQIGDITITQNNTDHTFLLEQELDLSEEQIQELSDPEQFYEEGTVAYMIIEPFTKAIQQVLAYIKYFGFVPELDENLDSQGIPKWSLDGINWTEVPMKYRSKWVGTDPIYVLHESFMEWIAEFIKADIVPFFAYLHLHKAFAENDTRHQWINATIAAELAFKEFLGIVKPDVIPLMTHLPSPSLPKMYKNILTEYFGEESPVYKSLGKGAEKRNELIHKPKMEAPSRADTEKYLLEVNVAIMHLHYLCHPKMSAIEFFYDQAKKQLKDFKS